MCRQLPGGQRGDVWLRARGCASLAYLLEAQFASGVESIGSLKKGCKRKSPSVAASGPPGCAASVTPDGKAGTEAEWVVI